MGRMVTNRRNSQGELMKATIIIALWLVLQTAGVAFGQSEFGFGNDED